MTAVYFIPLFVGLSVALTVILADILSPEATAASAAQQPQEKRPAAA